MSSRSSRRMPRSLARESRSSRRRWAWLVALLLIGTLVTASAGDHGVVRLLRLRSEHRGLEAKNGEMEADNVRLREEVRRLREDRKTFEKIAREELGMARPREIIYQFAPSGPLPGSPPAPAQAPTTAAPSR